MPKRPFIRRQKKKRHGTNFWDNEYKKPAHLSLSSNPSEDFLKFLRFLKRHHPHLLDKSSTALDLGCGNGRHLVFLANEYYMSVYGIDISQTAVNLALKSLESKTAHISVGSIAHKLPVPDQSCNIVLDMMSSHFLNSSERNQLKKEILRVLKPGGFLLFKTFLLDDDSHSKRLLKEYPGPEPNTYIHPAIGVPEYVYSEEILLDTLKPNFSIERLHRSHKHKFRGQARKRRTITVYAKNES